MRRSSPSICCVALVEQPDGVVPSVLRKLDADPRKVGAALREQLAKQPKAYGGAEPGFSPRLRVVLDAAQADAKSMQDEYVSTEHLLLGVLAEPGKRRPSTSSGNTASRASACSRR